MKNEMDGYTFFRAMKPLYYLSKPFGLAPFTINQHSNKFSTSPYESIYSVFVLTLEVTMIIFMVNERLRSVHLMATVKLTDIAEFVLTTSSAVLTLICLCFFSLKNLIQILNKLLEIDRLIMPNPSNEYKNVFKKQVAQVLTLVQLLITLFIADGILWGSVDKQYIFHYASVYPFYAAVAIACAQFSYLVLWLRKRVCLVNERLLAVWQRRKVSVALCPPLHNMQVAAALRRAQYDVSTGGDSVSYLQACIASVNLLILLLTAFPTLLYISHYCQGETSGLFVCDICQTPSQDCLFVSHTYKLKTIISTFHHKISEKM
ncbi:uncharacterized protein LOC124796107 [Schistocerca piceifrons]|uniref:uncharacterized protein LOC124796107 n=1 Tax=Schistocerca piceifrons TaxID=274613 RepID=UPI001F5EAAC2|nr:uncharacterized protein LOC124796107 [Schistocerca piceifrons]